MITIENIIYLISNLFRIYVIFRFTSLFFNRSTSKRTIEISSFLLYFIINSSMELYFENPLLNLGTNIILFFVLTFIYKGNILVRLICTVLYYVLSILIEGIIYMTMSLMLPGTDITVTAGVVSNIFYYMVVLILLKVFNRKEQYKMNIYHWIAIFLVPAGSIFVAATILLNNYNTAEALISVFILLLINILIFYLYDLILKSYSEKLKSDLLKQQNNAYLQHFELMKLSIQNMNILKHDFKNHFNMIQSLFKKNLIQELDEYLNSIIKFINISDEYFVSTDNLELDSILNYKINEVRKLNIKPNLCVQVPPKLNIDTFDMNIVVSNLLDNAIRALKNDNTKFFELNIRFDKEILYISVKNSFSDEILFSNNTYKTTKSDNDNHGIGLSSVENIVNKYNGIMDIEHENNIFSVYIMLYNSVNSE